MSTRTSPQPWWPFIVTIISVIGVFLMLTIAIGSPIAEYLGIAIGCYVVVAAWSHRLHEPVHPEVVAEYVVVGFIVWFILSSLH